MPRVKDMLPPSVTVKLKRCPPPGFLSRRIPAVISSFRVSHSAKIYLDNLGKKFHDFSFRV